MMELDKIIQLLNKNRFESLMPHQLAIKLCINIHEAQSVFAQLHETGFWQQKQLICHNCNYDVPIVAIEWESKIDFPFYCPLCDQEIECIDELTFDRIVHFSNNT